MLSAKSETFTSFPFWIPFIAFSSVIAVARTSRTMLNNSDESGHSCLITDLIRNAFSFSPLRIMFGKFGLGMQNEAGQRLIEFCQENALVKANTLFQQHKRRLYTWTSPDGQHRNQTDYSLCSQRWRSSIQSTKTRPGADCGSDQELLITRFRLKLKKVGKTARPFRYALNQIP